MMFWPKVAPEAFGPSAMPTRTDITAVSPVIAMMVMRAAQTVAGMAIGGSGAGGNGGR
ncbi:hypothetical protein [Streptomyces violascens]|uniref:hypothetical protein n=1 Tax=Streptomyces violascens TaxID=67381 RepID=UPI001672BC38|nr:hypothetical protein [Streptomyces violascens]GGU47220.1 hypothetical protein GCM10010289_79660 [Streptomyces violascens]